MTDRLRVRLVRPTTLTWVGLAGMLATIAFSAAFLVAAYPALPDILPVHFGPLSLGQVTLNRAGAANGWQYKTYARVLMPVQVEAALALILGGVAALLLSRSHGEGEERAPDILAASTAAEAVTLVAFIWVAFQAYAGIALVMMWKSGRPQLGGPYNLIVAAGVALSIVVGLRAQQRLGRPAPREFIAEHWRFGHLYRNPSDPALFVPTRTGSRWTLNFGRPVAAALLAFVLGVGIVGPTIILGLLLR
jgi:uncharacterized membrane protein